MKRIPAILFCILFCVSFAGCSTSSGSVDSSLSLVSEFEEDRQAEAAGSSAPDTSETDNGRASESTGEATETTVPDNTVESQAGTPHTPDIRPSGGTTGSNKTDTSKDADTSKEAKPTQPTASTETSAVAEGTPKRETEPGTNKPTGTQKPTETSRPTDTTTSSETAAPEKTTLPSGTTEPEETQTPAETAEPEVQTDPYAYPFDIEQIRHDCIALGKSYGFKLDESLTPDNSSWAGAETASADTQGTRLKRLLTEMVGYYSPAYREDMGLPAANITAFNIYCESTGSGAYRIYFLFLL